MWLECLKTIHFGRSVSNLALSVVSENDQQDVTFMMLD